MKQLLLLLTVSVLALVGCGRTENEVVIRPYFYVKSGYNGRYCTAALSTTNANETYIWCGNDIHTALQVADDLNHYMAPYWRQAGWKSGRQND